MTEKYLEIPEGRDRPGRPPDDVVKKVLQEEWGWRFEGPFYQDVPPTLSIYISSENIRRAVNYFKHVLLCAYYIYDEFGKDHYRRRCEGYSRNFSYYPFLKYHSRLQKKFFVNSMGCIGLLLRFLQGAFPDKYRQFCLIFNYQYHLDKITAYDDMEVEEKAAYAKEFDAVIYRLLEALST